MSSNGSSSSTTGNVATPHWAIVHLPSSRPWLMLLSRVSVKMGEAHRSSPHPTPLPKGEGASVRGRALLILWLRRRVRGGRCRGRRLLANLLDLGGLLELIEIAQED